VFSAAAAAKTQEICCFPGTAPARVCPVTANPGQISKLKGIGVLLGCAAILNKRPRAKIKFEIYGEYRNQPKEFGDEFQRQLAAAGSNVAYHGAYRQDQVDRLMRGVDAVLAPSIWWENSPVVIQEALRNQRPVICSDIGGMAEKVQDGVDGLHFSIGSEIDLGNLLLRLHDDRSILANLRQTLRPPPQATDVVAQHLELYAQVNSVTVG
jgi:glycosyltransferase involved in cell wall biosynthesis